MDELNRMLVDYTGNSFWQITALFLSIFVGYSAGKLLQSWLERYASKIDSVRTVTITVLKSCANAMPLLVLTLGIVVGIQFLTLEGGASQLAKTLSSVLILLAIAHLLYQLIDAIDAFLVRQAAKTESKLDDMLAPIARKSLRITLLILVLLQLATILTAKTPASIIASLGIGGLAIAFAAKDTVANFFGSLMLLADKPFEIGDRITVDGVDGPVQEVGLRSTKIRTLEGHLVTIPNGRLADMSIINIGVRPHIRRILNIGITYDTPPEKVEAAVAIVKELLQDHEGMDPEFPPRVYFKDFASTSLNLFVIYWYHPPAYWDYLAFTERFNLQVLKRFNEANIDFAFPTQTVYLAGDDKRPLEVAITQPPQG